ncbi:MAG: transposase zinc-binding domain-containing protein, partial [Myxococcota bacterium]
MTSSPPTCTRFANASTCCSAWFLPSFRLGRHANVPGLHDGADRTDARSASPNLQDQALVVGQHRRAVPSRHTHDAAVAAELCRALPCDPLSWNGTRLPQGACRLACATGRRTPWSTRWCATTSRDFLRAAAAHDGKGMPRFVARTFRAFLACGRPEEGFARLVCGCGHESVVAFSCKRRGICSSCMGRMTQEGAAHLVGKVLPHTPYRQWVVSFPFEVQRALAFRPDVLARVERMVLDHLRRFLEKRSGGKSGGLLVRHCMGSALNVSPHVHLLIVDGGFRPGEPPTFHAAPPLTKQDLEELCARMERALVGIL